MSLRTWLLLIIMGFIISPDVGLSVSLLYVFNYSTSIVFGLWNKFTN